MVSNIWHMDVCSLMFPTFCLCVDVGTIFEKQFSELATQIQAKRDIVDCNVLLNFPLHTPSPLTMSYGMLTTKRPLKTEKRQLQQPQPQIENYTAGNIPRKIPRALNIFQDTLPSTNQNTFQETLQETSQDPQIHSKTHSQTHSKNSVGVLRKAIFLHISPNSAEQ